jgi:C4-type Zn-finger protein
VEVPELELELSMDRLGGIVTTVEGLIVKICKVCLQNLLTPSPSVNKVDCMTSENMSCQCLMSRPSPLLLFCPISFD